MQQRDRTTYRGVLRFRSLQGFTLIELIVATAILALLTTMALPLARLTIKREKEKELRFDLWQMRDAIDRYKDVADRGAIQIKLGSQGYPPDLDTLVNGVDIAGKKVRFLRKIPVDPMTGKAEWGLRAVQDDPVSEGYLKQIPVDPFTARNDTWAAAQEDLTQSPEQTEPGISDVHSGSNLVGSDGTAYSTW